MISIKSQMIGSIRREGVIYDVQLDETCQLVVSTVHSRGVAEYNCQRLNANTILA